MKLVAISDTHGLHDRVSLPEGDVLVHAGDFMRNHDVETLITFLNWFSAQSHKYKVLVAGNHECVLDPEHWRYDESALDIIRSYPNISYLDNERLVIEGVRFYGTPIQPEFLDEGFNRPDRTRKRMFAQIPIDTQVLISHTPPFGILDVTGGRECGDRILLDRVFDVKPKVMIFGHIHAGYGLTEIEGIRFVNAAMCTSDYEPDNVAFIVDLFKNKLEVS